MEIIKNGKSNFKIELFDEKNEHLILAKNDLIYFVKESTGVDLDNKEAKNSIKIGFVPKGEEKMLENLNTSGYSIKIKGDDIYIFGKSPRSSHFGVYEFLQKTVAFKYYASDEVYFEKRKDIDYSDAEITVNPDIPLIYDDFYELKADKVSMYRAKSITTDEMYFDYFGGLFAHTTLRLLPPERDENNELIHKDWYNKEVNQLCWSNEEASDVLIERLKEYITKNPNGEVYLVGIEDNGGYCTCDRCKKLYEKYGISGVHARFIRKIALAIAEWNKTAFKDRKIYIGAFAYISGKEPPVKLDRETGEYVPIDETVILPDNVVLINAPIDRCGYHSINESCNRFIKARFKNWYKCVKRMIVWDYHEYYDNVFLYQANIKHYKENIRFYKDSGMEFLYAEGSSNKASGFDEYKQFLISNLGWNLSLEQEDLRKDFFTHYYKTAEKEMSEYYFYLDKHFADLEKYYHKMGKRGYHNSYDIPGHPDILMPFHWPVKVLDKCESILNKAICSADKIEDETVREKVLKRILREMCMVDFLRIEIHTYFSSQEEYDALLNKFKKDVEFVGFNYWSHWGHGHPIESLYGKWANRYPARSVNG